MLTARMGGEILRAGANLKDKEFVYRCRDESCDHPELELVVGRGLRVPHFRHKRRGRCGCPDGETDWHLEWKSHFDRIEENMGVDPVTGENNRADAVVGKDFVIEFQHSHISEEEQSNRERFYGSKGGMVWVVDASGTRNVQRLERAIRQKEMEQSYLKEPFKDGNYVIVLFPYEALPKLWAYRDIGVILDYGKDRDLLYVLPGHHRENNEFDVLCRWFKRDEVIERLKSYPVYFSLTEKQLRRIYEERQAKERAAIEARDKFIAERKQAMENAWMKARTRQSALPIDKMAIERLVQYDLLVWANGLVYQESTGKLLGNLNPPRPLARRGRYPRL